MKFSSEPPTAALFFCGEIETSRLKFSSEIKNFDRDQKFRSGSNFFDRWALWEFGVGAWGVIFEFSLREEFRGSGFSILAAGRTFLKLRSLRSLDLQLKAAHCLPVKSQEKTPPNTWRYSFPSLTFQSLCFSLFPFFSRFPFFLFFLAFGGRLFFIFQGF